MTRFSADGGDDGRNDRAINRPLPKRPRMSHPIICTLRRHNFSVAASTSDSGDRTSAGIPASTSAALPPLIERQSVPQESVAAEEESDTSWSGSSSDEESQEEQLNRRSGEEVPTVDPEINGNSRCLESDGPTVITLVDPHVLDCPICFESLSAPIYQCENGHIACATCCNRMKNKCSYCCWPIGYSRCRAIEKVIDSIKVTCPNAQYGCLEKINYSQKYDHEKTCDYAPCSCPHPVCNFVGTYKALYEHFTLQHSRSSKPFFFDSLTSISLDSNKKHVFLQERSQGALFVLNHSSDSRGTFVNVVCIAPAPSCRTTVYDLTASVGETSIRLKTHMEYTQKWTAQPPTKVWLMVPHDLISLNRQLRLDLIISKERTT